MLKFLQLVKLLLRSFLLVSADYFINIIHTIRLSLGGTKNLRATSASLNKTSSRCFASIIGCLDSSMVEQLTLNQLVEGSSPSRGTIFFLLLSAYE